MRGLAPGVRDLLAALADAPGGEMDLRSRKARRPIVDAWSAGLIRPTAAGVYAITPRGRKALAAMMLAPAVETEPEIPERATAVDPEPKPPEAMDEAVDGAGSSCEADPAERGGGPATSRSRMPGDTGTPGRAGEAGGSPAQAAASRRPGAGPEREALRVQVAELHAAGVSFAQIGRRLGITKNAAIGIAHRLELPDRVVRERTQGPEREVFPPAGHCVWPIGDPRQPGFRFCSAAAGGSPYCPEHREEAYEAASARSLEKSADYFAGAPGPRAMARGA